MKTYLAYDQIAQGAAKARNVLRGDSIRVVQPLFPVEGQGSIPMSPLQFKIVEIPLKTAKELNMLWHSRLPRYETGYLPTSRACFGAEYKNIYYATAIWGMPSSPSLPYKTWLELKRMAISNDAPKNTASRMIKIMEIIIKRNLPEVYMLISYQDTESHQGTIYKASNWKFGRLHKGAKAIRSKHRQNEDNLHGTGFVPKIRWEKQIRPEPKEAIKSRSAENSARQMVLF